MSRVVILSVLLFCTSPLLLQPSTLVNEHLIVTVDENTGRLGLAARNGSGNGGVMEQKNLLFFDQPPSSYVLIYMDDDLVTFGSLDGNFLKRPVVIDNSIETIWGNGLIRVSQVVRFVKRENTGVEDGVLLSLELENRTSRDMQTGSRVLWDTFLGEKGPSHFMLSDGNGLEYETDFESASLPVSWISRGEDEAGPCLRGVLQGRLIKPPTRVIFANYRSLMEQPVKYHMHDKNPFQNLPYSRNDSAVALYFGPVSLGPGESVEFKTLLGLCGEGDYVLEDQAVTIPVVPPQVEREEVEQLLSEIVEIESLRASMAQLNALIDELNSALESSEVSISEERLAEIRQILEDLANQ